MTAQTEIRTGGAPRAIAMMCVGVAFLASNDALAKALSERYDPAQIIFLRNLFALPMVAALVVILRGPRALLPRRLGLHAARGVLMWLGAYFFFTSLGLLPLAEATALIFAAPIFITALSVPILGEAVGWRRWGAVLLGFAGVLIVVQPGAETFQPASLLPIAAAVVYSLFMISARWLDPGESMWTTMLSVVFFPMVFAAPFAAWVWVPMQAEDLGLFIAIAVLGSLGITLMGQAFREAPAAVVAPFDYTALIWASLLGWAFWREIPASPTVAGAAVIALSGIIIVLREAAAARG